MSHKLDNSVAVIGRIDKFARELDETIVRLKRGPSCEYNNHQVARLLEQLRMKFGLVQTGVSAMRRLVEAENARVVDAEELKAIVAVEEVQEVRPESDVLVAYTLRPVYQASDQIGNAAAMVCGITDECLSGSGGGGIFLSPRVVGLIATGRLKANLEAA